MLALLSCGGGDPEPPRIQDGAGAQQQETRTAILSADVGTASLPQTITGFFYPTGIASYAIGAWWLAKDPDYFSGEYHLGLDIKHNYGERAYAIADGTVKRKSESGWGTDNCALAIEHKTGSGEVFVAIYGHLLCRSVVGERQPVTAGQPIGTVGHWPQGDHLHFGIHPGPYSTIAGSHWGRQFIEGNWPANSASCTGSCLNTMTDPVAFINEHYAYNPSTEEQVYCQGNVCWKPGDGSCESATSRYRIPNQPFVQQNRPFVEPAGSEVCIELAATIDSIIGAPNPQKRVPEEHGWQWWIRKGLERFGLVLTASAAELEPLREFRALNTVYVLEGRIVSGAASRWVYGTGPGYQPAVEEPPTLDPPDFVVKKVWLTTPWGTETYKFGLGENFDTKAQSANIGEGSCPTRTDEPTTITGHFYLSKGYKEDAHSGTDAWRRIDSTTTQCSSLLPGDTHTETKNTVISQWITEPGIYNIVYCIDHPQDDHNNGGDHPEKHESNNCSTEAVFEVTANQVENVPDVDFTVSGFTVLQAPVYAGDYIRLGAWITNSGTVNATTDIRSSYTVSCNGGPTSVLTDDGTMASTMTAGANAWEEIQTPVLMPNVSGTCTLTFTADYLGAQPETDETNNSASLTVTLAPRPAPVLSITRFEDKVGCCTTNTGAAPKPRIWVYNGGTAAPGANVTVVYQVSSPVATGGLYQVIGYGTIEPRELPPGTSDEDQMDCDGCWRIPTTSAWKKQWHNFRACLRVDGGTPVPSTGAPSPGEVCAVYQRYSKS